MYTYNVTVTGTGNLAEKQQCPSPQKSSTGPLKDGVNEWPLLVHFEFPSVLWYCWSNDKNFFVQTMSKTIPKCSHPEQVKEENQEVDWLAWVELKMAIRTAYGWARIHASTSKCNINSSWTKHKTKAQKQQYTHWLIKEADNATATESQQILLLLLLLPFYGSLDFVRDYPGELVLER